MTRLSTGMLAIALVLASVLVCGLPTSQAHAIMYGGGARVGDVADEVSGAQGEDDDVSENTTDNQPDVIEKTPLFVTTTQLVKEPLKYDGAYLEVTGEAVGDILSGDKEHKWVNISADDISVGVYLTVYDAEKITSLGAYGRKGTTVAVRGTFHAACEEGHAGELDLHASEVEVKDAGGALEVPQPVSKRLETGCILLLAGMLLAFVYWLVKRR